MDTSGRGHHRLPPFPTWLPGDDETGAETSRVTSHTRARLPTPAPLVAGGDVTEAPLARPL